ncbi:MAG: hypothetical protein PHQ18_03985 [Patescibacteria group bacterium]|nr:hypothetical protein [Patescibacteria group bacterium]
MPERQGYSPMHDVDHTRESKDYKNMDYKDRVRFRFEELWGEWQMMEAGINQEKDFVQGEDDESLRPEQVEILEILAKMGVDSEDKSGKGDFFHTDEELLGCLNDDNSINYEQLKKVLLKEAEHRAKDLPIQDSFNKGSKKVAQIPLPTNPESPTIVVGSGEGFEVGEHERCERKKHLLRIFRSKNLQFHPVFIDFDALSAVQKEKYGNMFRTIALDKRDGDVIHPGQYDVYVVPEKGLTFMVSDKYAEATYIVDNAPEDFEDIVKTISFSKEKKDEAEYPVAVIEWPAKGTMEEWRELIEEFLDNSNFSFDFVRKENKNYEYDEAPEGWLYVKQIAILLDRDRNWCSKKIDEIIENNPDKIWSGYYKIEVGKIVKHYSPELISILKIESNKYGEPPIGWLSIIDIADKIKKDRSWCSKRIDEIIENNPDEVWSGEYLNGARRISIYYSPELIFLLEEESNKYEEAPEDWLTLSDISDFLKRNNKWCQARLTMFLESNPDKEWQGKYLDKRNRQVCVHYSPELIALLEGEVNKYDKAPVGWLNLYELRKKFKKSRVWCEKRMKSILEVNSDKEWQREYLTDFNGIEFSDACIVGALW